MKTPSSNVVGE